LRGVVSTPEQANGGRVHALKKKKRNRRVRGFQEKQKGHTRRSAGKEEWLEAGVKGEGGGGKCGMRKRNQYRARTWEQKKAPSERQKGGQRGAPPIQERTPHDSMQTEDHRAKKGEKGGSVRKRSREGPRKCVADQRSDAEIGINQGRGRSGGEGKEGETATAGR